MVKISSNVGIPNNYAGRSEMYPWKDMKVGDSFPCDSRSFSSTVCMANNRYAPKVFSVRKYKNGFRCWRIK